MKDTLTNCLLTGLVVEDESAYEYDEKGYYVYIIKVKDVSVQVRLCLNLYPHLKAHSNTHSGSELFDFIYYNRTFILDEFSQSESEIFGKVFHLSLTNCTSIDKLGENHVIIKDFLLTLMKKRKMEEYHRNKIHAFLNKNFSISPTIGNKMKFSYQYFDNLFVTVQA